ncbi:universal stress protein [Streptomyces sp. NBC_00016]|uniref:universal stress protein n=1 Tax=Streptomyces sp. NBC_00016 TaxID=2975622 RepID=UPI003867B988
MERPLVVGVDGSDSSLEAVDWAVDEAARHRLAVRLVHGSRWERCERRLPALGEYRPSGVIMAESIAASCAEHARLRNPELKVSGEAWLEDAATSPRCGALGGRMLKSR